MGYGYDIMEVLARFDSLDPVLLASYAVTLACFVVYYVASLVKGFREKHCGMPWQVNMWNMSNDFLFVFVGFPLWWTPGLPTNHWTMHVIWVGMVLWFFAELATHVQSCKWDIHEIFPHVKKHSHGVIFYVLTQLVFISCYYWIWSAIDDPLVQIMIATTVIFCSLFLPLLLRDRNSTAGISLWSIWSVLVAQVAWWFVCLPAMSPDFSNPYTYFFGLCGVGTAVAALIKYRQLKAAGK